ncbi:hypothetical protein, partial [Pyrobaculum sp.]|uniref:hypothetical protein n=1 Tax=Pyrobaculum sp. TaxID=2004705 RepID=UPI003D1150E1
AGARLPPVPTLEAVSPPNVEYLRVAGVEAGKLDSEEGFTSTETKTRRAASLNVAYSFVDNAPHFSIVHVREERLDANYTALYWYSHYITL